MKGLRSTSNIILRFFETMLHGKKLTTYRSWSSLQYVDQVYVMSSEEKVSQKSNAQKIGVYMSKWKWGQWGGAFALFHVLLNLGGGNGDENGDGEG
jgi:hypothetical protein